MNATTVQEAKKNLDRLIEQVNADAEPTIICGDQGQKAVLLSLEEFNSWQETLYLLSNPANAEHLRQSMAEAQTGKTLERDLTTGGLPLVVNRLLVTPDQRRASPGI